MSAGNGSAEFDYDFRGDDEDEILYANGVLYGPPKTGKTTAAHTAPGRVLYFNWDTRNATQFARAKPENKGRVREPKIPRYAEGQTPVFSMMVQSTLDAYNGKWDTIVIDPLGEMYRRLLAEQTNNTRRPTLEARGNATSDLERWLRSMIEAPVNFIVVAHEMSADKGEDLVVMPFSGSKTGSMSGLGPKITGLVDFIAYSGVIEVEGQAKPQFVAQLRPGKGADGATRGAGSRFDVLMDEPYREINLAEWFTLAGAWTGQPAQESSTEQSADQQTQEVAA